MTTSIKIAYPCPRCGERQAILPPEFESVGMVRCAQCSQAHGSLDEVQKEIATKAREEGAQRVRQVYRTRPTGKYRNPTK